MEQNDEGLWGEVIYSYTRLQAIEDGVLVDITHAARSQGLGVGACLTRAVWDGCVEAEPAKHSAADTRLCAIMAAFRRVLLATQAKIVHDCVNILFDTVFAAESPGKRREKVRLKAVIHGDDEGNPTLTIMLPCED